MKLRNLKASFFLNKPYAVPKKVKNFILKHSPFSFTIYHHAPKLINVTGLKSFSQLTQVKQVIEARMGQKVIKIRIDNTFYSQKNFSNIDLNKVFTFMKSNTYFHVDYNVELFAGMYLQPKKEHYPTILLFRTGSYTMMGGKEKTIIEKCETFITSLIAMFVKQPSPPTNQTHPPNR